MSRRKREALDLFRHGHWQQASSSSSSKRRRGFIPPEEPAGGAKPPAATVVVIGLLPDCSVLDLKSRFEIYGCISRIRVDRAALGYITFRSKPSAEAAIAASLDPSFGITPYSNRIRVVWAGSDDALMSKESGSRSKLLRAEIPLSRRGRGNRLRPSPGPGDDAAAAALTCSNMPHRGRELVAYDDIL